MGPTSPFVIEKDESPIAVGDVVFCRVQPTHQYYAHFVRHADWDFSAQEMKYWIGGLQVRNNWRPSNGHCFRRDIFGILIKVYVNVGGRYFRRPHPQPLYQMVLPLVAEDAWSSEASGMCEPEKDEDMEPPVRIHKDDTETAAGLANLKGVTGPHV